MSWSTIRETTIRRFCPPIAANTTTWSDSVLQGLFTDAHVYLRGILCPPFDKTEFETLNAESTATSDGSLLIGRWAAQLIWETLPGSDLDYLKYKRAILEEELLEYQTGERTLYLSTGQALSISDMELSHNNEGVQPVFRLERRDSSGNIVKDGSFDP